jgi:UDP-N-acetylmuramoylalanine--D-glutamate ligase
VGLARSGQAAARVLIGRGETVIACDGGRPDVDLPGAEVHLVTDGVPLLGRARCIVKSPGVPKEAEVIATARDRGVPVIGELELAWRLLPNDFLAVTGTNGKTTTAELLGAIHREAGVPVAVAGNVGTPLSSLVGVLEPAAVVVSEASSFQLEDTVAFAPECAVLLNVEEDHLDRHGTFDAYLAAKLEAFARQGPDDVAVVPPGIHAPGAARRVELPDLGPDDVRLRGAHNLENARAAAAAALARGIPEQAVRTALMRFPGVPHRLEEVAELGEVLYVNDSKATNVASAVVGIEAFDGGVHVILGGSLKGGGFAGLREAVASRCRAAYLIGEAAEPLARDLEPAGVPLVRSGTLEQALDDAYAAARPGDVVLLSPACASFDQFEDFEQRGNRFRELVSARA